MPAEILTSPKAVWIQKSERRLIRYENGEPVKSYLIAIGRNEAASKDAAGDWATPEGLYHVRKKNPQSRFHLALQIDYPNRTDADRGLAEGILSRNQYEAIASAIDRGEMPPQDTRLGCYIEIHGGYNTVRMDAGGRPYLARWTRGCVGLQNADIDEIYAWAPDGMPVFITP